MFLDGSTFRSVDKARWSGTCNSASPSPGGNTRLSYTHLLRTREFEDQDRTDDCGTVSLSVQF